MPTLKKLVLDLLIIKLNLLVLTATSYNFIPKEKSLKQSNHRKRIARSSSCFLCLDLALN